jgi:hypothetical protein
MIQNDENSNQEETWGWGPYGSEEDVFDTSNAVPIDGTPSRDHTRTNSSAELRKSSSEKSFTSKRQLSNHVLKGIASSPSFQELEKAIGVELSQSSTDENGETKTLSPNASFATSKLSSTNLMQQKVMQHRVRQQHIACGYQNPRINHSAQKPSSGFISQPAKSELSPFINESESRALVLFHSPAIPQILVRDVCSKFGVLYYIRPEFHAKGVTFLSYFDLQSSLSAKESLPSALGSAAEASVHFSIMLHATTSNTEEFRLIVKSVPDTVTEGEIQNICSRYGPLRSIQKTFGSATDLSYSDARHISLSYSVEYFNIQDARLAASELSATSSNIWGPEALVRFGPLDERKKQLCKQLLGVLSRWRSELAQPLAALPFLVPQTPVTMVPQINSAAMSIPHGLHYSQLAVPQPYSSPSFAASLEYGIMPVQSPFLAPPLNPSLFHNLYNSPFASTYSGVFVDQGSPRLLVPSPPFGMEVNNHFQLSQLQDNGHFFPTGVPVRDYVDTRLNGQDHESEYNSSVVPRDDPSFANTSRHGPQQGSRYKQHRESSDVDFSLDTSRLLDGSEKRTTIMVFELNVNCYDAFSKIFSVFLGTKHSQQIYPANAVRRSQSKIFGNI